MKVFVSSIISGFEEFRSSARGAIRSLGHEPVMAEDFGARSDSPQVACLQGLRGANLVVLILGQRYGTVPAGSQSSPTHEEYLEARQTKPVLLFVQEGVSPEPRQAELLDEAQGWRGGLFRAGFQTAEDLRNSITSAIHRFELAHAAAPLNIPALLSAADAVLSRREDGGHGRAPKLRFAVVGGPRQQVLRPAELEADGLGDALHQRAMFGSPRIFERSTGVERRIEGDALVLEQAGDAALRLGEYGDIEIQLPLERPGATRRGFVMLGIIEEVVLAELANAISFASFMLDHVDSTQRLTHLALAAKIEAGDFMGWRTQAQQDASPNSGTMRIGGAPDRPVRIDRTRGALKFDATRLAEDLMVPLRRQWKA